MPAEDTSEATGRASPVSSGAQLELELSTPCPGCGSRLHDGCGYDPNTVRPALTMAEAVSQTLARIDEEDGAEGLRRVGVVFWPERRPPT